MTALPKFCIFCGSKPESKTKEHIIPQWLIKLTGDPNRKVNLGVDTAHLRKKNEFKFREYSFSSFSFPACEKCNAEFSDLESEAKTVIEKILVNDYLSSFEINILLNWFDKVRIGLWLGALLLDREIAPVDPNFFIKKRMAEKDRCLFVYEINDNWQGVQFVGFDTPAFLFTPSCFSLCINNFYFFNISTDFLFAKNIGFPFPVKKVLIPKTNQTRMEFNKGLEKIRTPLIRKQFVNSSIEIYQPIIPKDFIPQDEELSNFYNCSYVKNNCFDFQNGLGGIFYRDSNSILMLDDESELCLSDGSNSYDRKKFMKRIEKQVMNTQLYLTKQMPSVEDLSPEGRRQVNKTYLSVIKMQKEYLKIIE